MFAMCLLIFVVYAELIEVKILDIYVQSNFFMCNQFSSTGRGKITAIKAYKCSILYFTCFQPRHLKNKKLVVYHPSHAAHKFPAKM